MNHWKKPALWLAPFLCLAFPLMGEAAETNQTGTEDFRKTTWTEMAERYDNPYMDIDEKGELSPDVLAKWWTVFDDDTLNHLITLTLNQNRDLAAAESRLRQAREAVGISKAARLPWIDANGGWMRGQVPDDMRTNLVNVSGVPVPISASLKDKKSLSYAGLDASWELDVFGRVRSGVKASERNVQAANGELYAAWVSLSAETAMNYITLRALQEELAVTEQHIANMEESQRLMQINYDSGLVDELPVKETSYTLNEMQAEVPLLKKDISQTLTRLSILTGTVPGELDAELMKPKPLPAVNPVLYDAIPAETLRQRPDVHAAERLWAAQVARTAQARAELKPRFNILGILGLATFGTGGLFSSSSKAFGILPQMTYPLFHGGALRKNVRIQSEKEKEAQANYENTVLKAAGEVRTSMAAIAQDKSRVDALAKGRENAKDAVDISQTDFNSGLSDYMHVLDAQRHYLSLDQNYTVARGSELVDLVSLFKALGGGWQGMDEKQEAEASNHDKKTANNSKAAASISKASEGRM